MRREAEIALRLRQQELLLRIGQQRAALAQDLQVLAGPLDAADALHRGWRLGRAWLQAHAQGAAVAAAVAAALLVVLRPRRVLRWGWRAAWALRTAWPWVAPAWRAWRQRGGAPATAGGAAPGQPGDGGAAAG